MIARIKQFASFHFLPAFEPTGRSLNLPIKSIKLVPYTVSFVLSSQQRTDNKFPIDKVDDRMLNRIIVREKAFKRAASILQQFRWAKRGDGKRKRCISRYNVYSLSRLFVFVIVALPFFLSLPPTRFRSLHSSN